MATVTKPTYDVAHENPFTPARIEHRTARSGLTQLGTYVMTFDVAGTSEPWTLHYEETIYVITGRLALTVIDGDGSRVVEAGPDEIVVIPKESTVQYGAEAATRLLLSISPVDWREVESHSTS